MYLNRREIAELDVDEDVTLVDVEKDMNADVQGRLAESQAKVYHLDLQHAEKVLKVFTIVATTITAAQVPKDSTPRRRRGVVIQDPKETTTALVIVHTKVKSKDKDEAFARQLEAELNENINWGMTYNDIRPIFKKHYNSIQAFLEKGEKEIKEEGSKRKGDSLNQDAAKKQRINEGEEELKAHLQIIVNDDDDDVFTEATPLASKVPVVDYQIHYENNKPYYKIIRADGTHKLFLSFIPLLKNFDREDLEML
nr:hypothetical protein [Tanacetum cinerariifolium]